jgi:hypothetical protein
VRPSGGWLLLAVVAIAAFLGAFWWLLAATG